MTRGCAQLSAVLVFLAVAATACGTSDPGPGVMPAPATAPAVTAPPILRTPEMVPVDPEPAQELDSGGRRSMSPVEHDVADAVRLLAELTAGASGAGPVALDEAGPGLLLHWFGDPPREVLETIAERYPDVDVQVVPTLRSGEDVHAIAQQVLEAFGSRGVGCVAAAPDASSLDLCIDHQLDEDQRLDIAGDVERATGLAVPVAPGGNPVPAPAAP